MSGKKADNLYKLTALGLQVPEFYVVSATDLRQLGTAEADAKLVREFQEWCVRHNVQVVAVRSSATAEDSKEQSFAGQFASVMQVAGTGQFLAALQTVFAGRPKGGYHAGKDYEVHAIVQRYVEPDAAGVLFTVNPSNGQAEMLVNAARGHGGAVVDGEDAQAIHIDRISGDVRAEDSAGSSLLSRNQLARLTTIGTQIEQSFGCPQDIEWAVRGEELFILQARPITRISFLKVWDNANIGESFPGIVMPLTFSIARRGYELVYKSQGLEGGLSWYDLEANHRTFHDMVGLFGGRMYYNLASWYKFIGLFPSNHRNQKFLDAQLQTVGDVVYLPPSSYPLKRRVRFYARALRRSVFFEREKRRYWQRLDQAFAQYDSLPVGQSLPILFERYAFVEQMIVPQMGRSADNDFFVMTYHGVLQRCLRKWLSEKNGQNANFLGALHDVISARQAELLTAIANVIKHDEQAARFLKDKSYAELDDYLRTTEAQPLLEEYRAKFLHRFAGDQKIEAVNPLLTLEGFYGLIATYCQLDEHEVAVRRSAAATAERQRHERIVRQLGPLQRPVYRLLLRRLKHHLRIREQNRLLRGKAYALLRDLFPSVGAALVETGVITHAKDVYYLDIEEIMRYANGTGYEDDAKQTIAARKLRYASYEKFHLPSRFTTTGLTDQLPESVLRNVDPRAEARTSLSGTVSSPGDVTGRVVVLDEPVIPEEPFDILVVSHTDPGWTPLIALAKGVIVEHGGMLSHAAIVTRELGIPSMIGVENVTQVLKNGMKVHINTAKSTIDILE